MNFDEILRSVAKGLEATFARSACGPLPHEKGKPREVEMANFFSAWLPSKIGMATNAHVVRNHELSETEADLVFYDGVMTVNYRRDARGQKALEFKPIDEFRREELVGQPPQSLHR